MQTAAAQPSPTGATTPQRTGLPIKHISLNGLYKAAETLGAKPCRTTGGHNYVVYRFPNNKQVHLPPKRGGPNLIGRGELHAIISRFLSVGIPKIILENVLHDAGAAWHETPQLHPGIIEQLNTNPSIAKNSDWHNIMPAPPEATTNEANEKKPDKPLLVSLHHAIRQKLPAAKNNHIVNEVHKRIREHFDNGDEPYNTLLAKSHVTTKSKGNKLRYQLTSYAETVVADLARNMYDTLEYESSLPQPPQQQKWSGLELHEVALLDVPTTISEQHATQLEKQLAAALTRRREQPYSRLTKEMHVIHMSSSEHPPHGRWLITEHAASVLAHEARANYEAILEEEAAAKPELTRMSLRQVIINALPSPTSRTVINHMSRSFAQRYGTRAEPFNELIENNHIERYDNNNGGYDYALSEHAISVLTAEAKKQYKHRTGLSTPAVQFTPDTPSMSSVHELAPKREDLTNRPLRSMISEFLPPNTPKKTITLLAGLAGIGITHGTAPYGTLIAEGHLTRHRKPGEEKYTYSATPHGAIEIARKARQEYDERYAHTNTPQEEDPAAAAADPTAAAQPAPAPAATEDAPMNKEERSTHRLTISEAVNQLMRTHSIIPTFNTDLRLDTHHLITTLERKTRAAKTPAEQPTLEVNEALNALLRRYKLTPTFDADLRINLNELLINLAAKTRTKKPAEQPSPDEEELPF